MKRASFPPGTIAQYLLIQGSQTLYRLYLPRITRVGRVGREEEGAVLHATAGRAAPEAEGHCKTLVERGFNWGQEQRPCRDVAGAI